MQLKFINEGYSGGLSLPTRLPWASARALLAALLDSISAAATTPLGVGVANALTSSAPVAADAQSAWAVSTARITISVDGTVYHCQPTPGQWASKIIGWYTMGA